MKMIKIKINGKTVACEEGSTIMRAAKSKGINIPGLCGHPDLPIKANCRVCVVEVVGRKNLVTSCSTKAENGMEILTESGRVRRARNANLELIYAEHIEKCPECIWRFECKLLKTAQKYKLLITTFRDRKKDRRTYKFANAVEIDGTQCIDCRNCVDACSLLQNIHYLELAGKGVNQEVVPTKKKNIQCILCGQCAVHCPVSAAQEQAQWRDAESLIKNKSKSGKIMVAQFAPSIRVSIGEDFGLPYGQIVTEQIVAGLRQLGFDYVFDVNFSADITTIIEAEELLSRLSKKTAKAPMPMITSCCPGWVNYAEIYHPEILPHLTTARSPHIHGGGIIKTYWAKKMGLNPKNIVVVSIMPCTAKKYEAKRPEMKIKGLYPVDNVLTTREFSFMLKKNNLDLSKLKKSRADNPLGEYSGAAAIFGGSGGVMESALRAAHVLACGDRRSGVCRSRVDYKAVRGSEDIKEATVAVAGKMLRVAVVNGIGHVEPVLKNLKKYDYIEVMACPGGCIGGGGQPIPTSRKIISERAAALHEIDKKSAFRKSYDNKGALDVLKWLKNENHKLEHAVLHTKYKKRRKY
ncbi:hypothetical protein A2303_01635 [Candidatus Falkowbacteria bacterium RIFOXYB2_FULL_47_14]|uniref:Ferredoxin n=1 Tax=Candidatus Falkowbacteria bacterium RIFOXYA2_FULL_47_19 TaxID=1797994 RepID=A0A1F5SLJ0_9BACT|nr:MAG: hypothetical protein A2227_01710 [Candidatus Falkowbacteria bacterium RIFOXYA2_FULL_47_19]OGF34792.1 MAG: hypothetical protein A2468_03600 [Candidatus Falkowbacteria bacterium RIFOXYC2_FULL_46_15]OGF43482.1 MAG: hypothetical protein A2303_01635 [Candidatus Falkowbacteria bacterium RIFOXYB2_FULL_47_14]